MFNISHVYKSPNFDVRASNIIDMLVIHATKMEELPSLERLCDPASQVSCHYLISQNGEIYCLVDEEKRAWHAGVSYWNGREKLNHYSIGIELVNPDYNLISNKFTEVQMEALTGLCLYLIKKYNIPDYNIVAHSDIAPDRKDDPGNYFDWKLLAKRGVGFYPDVPVDRRILMKFGDHGAHILKMQKLFRKVGYKIDTSGIFDEEFVNVVIAFKRRYYQHDLSSILTQDVFDIVRSLLSKYKLISA